MFGNKGKKRQRLLAIGRLVRRSEDGLTQADLARELDVPRSTINKDLGIIQDQTGILLSEDNGRLYWVEGRQ